MERLYVSANRRFLVQGDGRPFFWLGDTAWSLFHRLAREEADSYLENRARKGFNVIQAVALAEHDGITRGNAYGDLALIDADPEQPNDAYFAHVDYVVAKAAELGLYIGLLPTWGDKVHLAWGVGPVIFTPENARVYGQFLGERYRSDTNIIWILGGDRVLVNRDTDYSPTWREMALGILDSIQDDHIPLMTFHPQGGRGSSEYLHDEPWLSLNMWQSGHGERDRPNWDMIASDYKRRPIKPVLDGEPNYEDHPIGFKAENGYFRDYDVRKAAYRAVFSGACGHTYGHHSIWQFYSETRDPVTSPDRTWSEAIDRPGAFQVGYLRRLMESRPYLSRIPDQSLLVTAPGDGPSHIRATRCAEGSYAMIYVPTPGRRVQVDLSSLSGQEIVAWWFNPRNGEADTLGEFMRGATATFNVPAVGPDWVLVLDDKSRGFGPPGA
jgi:hypothetical protein